MSDLIKRGKECAEAWFSQGYFPDAELVLELIAEIERLQTFKHAEYRVSQEAQRQIERLEKGITELATGNIERWERECAMANHIAKLEAAVVDAARHLLAGGDKEAVYHLEKALAALEDSDE